MDRALKALVNRLSQVSWNNIIVSAYKVGGFVILAAILAGMASYLSTTVFFLVDHSWIQPAILSPTDERVLKITSQIADESARRDRLLFERRELAVRLEHERRIMASEESFQGSIKGALQGDIDARRADLAMLQKLVGSQAKAKAEIVRARAAYADLSHERLEQLFAAHVIDQDGLVNGTYQLAQITHSGLLLDESQVNLDLRMRGLSREAASMQSLASLLETGEAGPAPFGYDVLRIKQAYDKSVLEHERARASGDALEKNIQAMDATISEHEGVIAVLRGSPYLRAAAHEITVAFVPYENVENMSSGVPVYGCLVGFLWCEKVGSVTGMLDGEARNRHPIRNSELRGQLVSLEVDGAAWSRRPILYTSRKPLLF
jgi:hypothetical protein